MASMALVARACGPYLKFPTLTLRDGLSQAARHIHAWPSTLQDHRSHPAVVDITESSLPLVSDHINKCLKGPSDKLNDISRYYFDGQGKLFRPTTILLTGKACHLSGSQGSALNNELQIKIAAICEMIHTASLVHDDVIDKGTSRRGKPSINVLYKEKECIAAGDYILAHASMLLASLGSVKAVEIISQAIEDLVKGELLQLGTVSDPKERFEQYLRKTFLKTASLLCRGCQAAALLSGCDEEMQVDAYNYGKHLGIAFQVVDDILDCAGASTMGKETAVDMKLGLATAPVLYASEEFPELNDIIMRQFSVNGDVERATELINSSEGIMRAKSLAAMHCSLAEECAMRLTESDQQAAMIAICQDMLKRTR